MDAASALTKDFATFQYYVNIVPTTFIDPRGYELQSNQYSVTNYVRTPTTTGAAVPGIFIRYDVEPLKMTIRERTTSLFAFVVRMAGVPGGIWVCSGMALRVLHRARMLGSSPIVQSRLPTASAGGGGEPLWQASGAQDHHSSGANSAHYGEARSRAAAAPMYHSQPQGYAPTYPSNY